MTIRLSPDAESHRALVRLHNESVQRHREPTTGYSWWDYEVREQDRNDDRAGVEGEQDRRLGVQDTLGA
jgi:hypothetical protein